MEILIVVIVVVVLLLIVFALAVRIIKQYERGVLFRLGRLRGVRAPGLRLIIPFADVLHRVSLRIVTMPIQSQGIITKDNVAWCRRQSPTSGGRSGEVDRRDRERRRRDRPDRPDHAAQGRGPSTASTRSSGDRHAQRRSSARSSTPPAWWGVEVPLVELKDIMLPDTMKRAMARQAEAEREKRAKIIAAEGEALSAGKLGDAADVMIAHPVALQLRNLQVLVEIGVNKNTTVVFPAPLMSTIEELGSFLAREKAAALAHQNASAARPAAT